MANALTTHAGNVEAAAAALLEEAAKADTGRRKEATHKGARKVEGVLLC